jgi:DNA-binding SARP family transcriptional activator
MSGLRVTLLGSVRIEHQGRPVSEQPTRAVQSLLAYLLVQRHRCHSRDVLAAQFWADQNEDSARGCLNTAVWRLRRVLEPDGIPRGTYLIKTGDGELGFNSESNHWLDITVLETGIGRLLSRPATAIEAADVEQVQSALQLYAGDFLEGNYHDWVLRERERLRALYLNALARIMRHHHGRGAFEEGLVCGEKILALDPLREEIHREMMRMYLKNGQRVHAARQYEICRDLLAAELNVEPMDETRAVYAQIAGGNHQKSEAHTFGTHAETLHSVLQRLRDALCDLEQARERCQRALQLAERLADGHKR